jgi:hypothetical protein
MLFVRRFSLEKKTIILEAKKKQNISKQNRRVIESSFKSLFFFSHRMKICL